MIRCPIVLKRLSWERDTSEISYRGLPARHSGARPELERKHPPGALPCPPGTLLVLEQGPVHKKVPLAHLLRAA